MRKIRFLVQLMLVMAVGALLPALAVTAQSGDMPTLHLLQSVTGEINNTNSEQHWSFDASKDQLLSVRMQATSGNLEPYIELDDVTGKVLAKGTTTSYGISTIDSFVAPQAATYTLRASRAFGDNTANGAYTLSLLPGYSFLLISDPAGDRSLRMWHETNANSQPASGSVRLQLTGDNTYTWTDADKLGVYKDLYLQADIQPEPVSAYWEGGLMVRGVKRDGAFQFYLFFVNSDNKWKLSLAQPTGLKMIQDWTPLPDDVTPTKTLGIKVSDTHFKLYYNNQPLSEITDSTINEPGEVGVAVGTAHAPNNSTSILFSNLVLTLPTDEMPNGLAAFPAKLSHWQQTSQPIMEELGAAHIIQSTGRVGFELDQAFVTNSTNAGIVYQPLAHGTTFTDIVYTADVSWDSNSDNIACALEFRAVDDSNFSIVYVDRKGGYGIRQVSKDNVVASLYNLSDVIHKENQATNRVTVVAVANWLVLYINGTLVSGINVKADTGAVQVAAYNYGKAGSVCQFHAIWLRTLDR